MKCNSSLNSEFFSYSVIDYGVHFPEEKVNETKTTYLPDFEGESFVLCIRGTVHYHVKIASLLLLRLILVCRKCSCKVSKFALFLLVLSH